MTAFRKWSDPSWWLENRPRPDRWPQDGCYIQGVEYIDERRGYHADTGEQFRDCIREFLEKQPELRVNIFWILIMKLALNQLFWILNLQNAELQLRIWPRKLLHTSCHQNMRCLAVIRIPAPKIQDFTEFAACSCVYFLRTGFAD